MKGLGGSACPGREAVCTLCTHRLGREGKSTLRTLCTGKCSPCTQVFNAYTLFRTRGLRDLHSACTRAVRAVCARAHSVCKVYNCAVYIIYIVCRYADAHLEWLSAQVRRTCVKCVGNTHTHTHTHTYYVIYISSIYHMVFRHLGARPQHKLVLPHMLRGAWASTPILYYIILYYIILYYTCLRAAGGTCPSRTRAGPPGPRPGGARPGRAGGGRRGCRWRGGDRGGAGRRGA
jgi:hypothetical protein